MDAAEDAEVVGTPIIYKKRKAKIIKMKRMISKKSCLSTSRSLRKRKKFKIVLGG